MYEVLFSDTAKKQLSKLQKDIQLRILFSLERIRFRPGRNIKKMVGDPSYCLRVGNYRVILDIDKSHLLILVIKLGHRKNIYKKVSQ